MWSSNVTSCTLSNVFYLLLKEKKKSNVTIFLKTFQSKAKKIFIHLIVCFILLWKMFISKLVWKNLSPTPM